MGERCAHEILEADMLAIAVVAAPFNKYSVFGVTSKEDDAYSYSAIEFLVNVIDHPFNRWRFENYEVYEPHAKYKEGRNDPCPCGSKKKYKNCCLKQNGVKVPHTQFYLEEPTINGRNMAETQKERVNHSP